MNTYRLTFANVQNTHDTRVIEIAAQDDRWAMNAAFEQLPADAAWSITKIEDLGPAESAETAPEEDEEA